MQTNPFDASRGHSKSPNVDYVRYGFLVVSNSNLDPKMHHVETFDFE